MAKFYPAFYMTEGIVGAGQRNNADDVKLLKILFKGLKRRAPSTWSGIGQLTIDGTWSSALEEHIRAFQQTGYGSNVLVVDGIVHPMRMRRGDLRATFRSGVGSTLYWLNVASMANSPREHAAVPGSINLRPITEVA
ncbi:MAG: peptidoglycan-binding domain-containing protein [Pseudomonadota bacterium]